MYEKEIRRVIGKFGDGDYDEFGVEFLCLCFLFIYIRVVNCNV